ncbi:MAG: hypothetical protein V1784_05085 [bacterium]
MQRRGKKTLRAELLKSKNAVAKGRALAARKKRVIARGKAGVAASALNEKRRKAQAKYGVGAKSRAKAVSGRAPARGVAPRRVSRWRRAAPRLLRCSACGGVVLWVSVDRRCFPCLKRGIAARKREDEFALGVFEIEEEFVPAVQ